MRQCVYPGCLNKRTPATIKRLSFHKIPQSNVETRKLWLTALQLDVNLPHETTQYWTVCSDHFEAKDFFLKKEETSTVSPKKRAGLRRLKRKSHHTTRSHTSIRENAVPKSAHLQVCWQICC